MLLIMKSVRKWSISGMDIVQSCTNGTRVGDGWRGEDVLPKGKQSVFMGIRLSVTYPGENNVFQVLWLPCQ